MIQWHLASENIAGQLLPMTTPSSTSPVSFKLNPKRDFHISSLGPDIALVHLLKQLRLIRYWPCFASAAWSGNNSAQ